MAEREIGMPRDDEAYASGGAEIGSRNAAIRTLQLDLSTARERVKIDFAGLWLWAQDAVGLNANVDIFYNESIGQATKFRRGMVIAGYPFHRLYVTNTAQAGASLTFKSSMQMIDIQNALSTAQTFVEKAPDIFTTAQVAAIGAAATLIAPASALRRRITIKALSTNTAPVYIGNILVAVGNGYELTVGQQIEIKQTTLDIYGIRGGVAQGVTVIEETDLA